MKIDFYSYSGIGGRPVNEDSHIIGDGFYIVSDGLGGHDNGELASGAVTRHISENFTAADLSNEHVSALISGADEAVRLHGKGGKATLAALFTDGNMIRIDNIGDSRVYYFRGGNILFRTKDHSVCQAAVDMGEMTDNDVRNSPDRSGLFKVLGDSDPVKLPKPYGLIEPMDDDAFLICSDGFWEHVYEAEMEADLLKSENAKDWLEHMLKRLLIRSENSGDNFTAICGFVHKEKNAPYIVAEPVVVPVADVQANNGVTETSSAPSETSKKHIIILICALIAVAAVILAVVLIGIGSKDDNTDDLSVSSSADESIGEDETADGSFSSCSSENIVSSGPSAV